MVIAIVAILSFVIGATLAGIAGHICNLTRRIRQLEQAQAKHLPYRTADEIENATAAINALQFELDFKKGLLDNALGHLQNARAGK